MTSSFVERWTAEEHRQGIKPSRMVKVGNDLLPHRAAPFLSFEAATNPMTISDNISAEEQWPDAERQRLRDYLLIGTDGSGDPICLHRVTGTVVLLDHEDSFGTITFINSSIHQLAECLLAYMDGKDGAIFGEAVQAIDPRSMQPGNFWWQEAIDLNSLKTFT